MEKKLVTWRHLQPGQEIKGYKLGNLTSGFSAIVKETNAATVSLYMWGDKNKVEMVSAEAMFSVEMNEEDFRAKYRDQAAECLRAMQNKLHRDEIGYHEQWNSWLFGNPYELAAACKDKKIQIMGHCSDIISKEAFFSGDILDVGVCAEYEDGERFWCHFRSSDIDDMIRLYGDELGITEGK